MYIWLQVLNLSATHSQWYTHKQHYPTAYSECFKFVPSMSDVKSQRQLRNRLQNIGNNHYITCSELVMIVLMYNNQTAVKLKQKSELSNEESKAKEEEKRKQRQATVKLKAQQRAEVRKSLIGM